jgi:microcystin degradation protein MlrC
MLEKYRGSNSVIGGFIAVCEREGVEMVPILMTSGGAAGPAADDALVHYGDRICAGLAALGDVDGVLLDLHGAMATPTRLDPDRELAERVRAVVGRSVPVVVALDYHGNIDDTLLRVADAVFGYHFSPHIDMGDTGERAARCLVRTLRGEIKPVTAIAKPGVMVPSIFSATDIEPLAGIVQESLAVARQSQRWLDVSVFAGFSYADVPNCGFSVVAVADGDAALARDTAHHLSNRIRAERHALMHRDRVLNLKAGVDAALKLAETATKPVVILEHADRMNDSTYVLRELVRRGVTKVAVPFVCDPVAGDKTYRTTGPVGRGGLVQLGPTAVIDADGIVISITSHQRTAIDEDPFVQFGMNARDFRIIVLRSKTHFRAVYEPLAEQILIVDTPDWGPADLTTLPYRNVHTDRVFPFSDHG